MWLLHSEKKKKTSFVQITPKTFRLQWRIASAFVSNKDNFSACVRAFFFFTSVNSSRL
jgi:hypothetical protein